MIRIVKRGVTQNEAKLLVAQIKLTPNIMGYSLEEWLSAEHVLLAEEDGGALAGACLSYNFQKKWRKIAALIVFEEFRSQGIGKQLFSQSFDEALKDGKNIYTVSANPTILRMMDELKFENFRQLIDLTKTYPSYSLLIYRHTLGWMLNWYRFQEIMRKAIIYKNDNSFVLGVKLIESD